MCVNYYKLILTIRFVCGKAMVCLTFLEYLYADLNLKLLVYIWADDNSTLAGMGIEVKQMRQLMYSAFI